MYRSQLLASVGGAVLGGVLAALPLALYNAAVFGSMFHLGYTSVVGFEGMRQGVL